MTYILVASITFTDIPNIAFAHSIRTGNRYSYSNIIHRTLEICTITKGHWTIIIDGNKHYLEEGDCIVIPLGSMVSCSANDPEDNSHITFGLNSGFTNEYNASKSDTSCKLPIYMPDISNKYILDLYRQLIVSNSNKRSGIGAIGLVFQILNELENETTKRKDLTSDCIYCNTIKNYINSNINKYITLDDLSKYTGLSAKYICAVFRKGTGTTVVDYINTAKINKAKEYLLNGGLNIDEISMLVGIENSTYFSRMFKKYEGVCPRDYRIYKLNKKI